MMFTKQQNKLDEGYVTIIKREDEDYGSYYPKDWSKDRANNNNEMIFPSAGGLFDRMYGFDDIKVSPSSIGGFGNNSDNGRHNGHNGTESNNNSNNNTLRNSQTLSVPGKSGISSASGTGSSIAGSNTPGTIPSPPGSAILPLNETPLMTPPVNLMGLTSSMFDDSYGHASSSAGQLSTSGSTSVSSYGPPSGSARPSNSTLLAVPKNGDNYGLESPNIAVTTPTTGNINHPLFLAKGHFDHSNIPEMAKPIYGDVDDLAEDPMSWVPLFSNNNEMPVVKREEEEEEYGPTDTFKNTSNIKSDNNLSTDNNNRIRNTSNSHTLNTPNSNNVNINGSNDSNVSQTNTNEILRFLLAQPNSDVVPQLRNVFEHPQYEGQQQLPLHNTNTYSEMPLITTRHSAPDVLLTSDHPSSSSSSVVSGVKAISKKDLKRIKNTIAARNSRKRKADKMSKLEDRVQELETENTKLRGHIGDLVKLLSQDKNNNQPN
ncbi:Transcriptional activator [Sugiyamaella lignohabitans]|uniref:Transcriptional activator n=1 Tax=Sugiyamaella lignohabitans TaxID=796027 RepID=A0A167DN10_9ASCO|nr:Transcriptional activator [Sugiyamaella lignohabitans]ANB13090.1 Transcriptional activator [Sugiyamaella lignohabitans]